jgi:hypothetical protein
MRQDHELRRQCQQRPERVSGWGRPPHRHLHLPAAASPATPLRPRHVDRGPLRLHSFSSARKAITPTVAGVVSFHRPRRRSETFNVHQETLR